MSDSAQFRSGKALPVEEFVPNVLDPDASLSTNADDRLTTQKAAKGYADTKMPQDLSTLETTNAGADSDLMLIYDVTTSVPHVVTQGTLLMQGAQSSVIQVELNALHQEVSIGTNGPVNVHIHPHSPFWVENAWMMTGTTGTARESTIGFGSQNSALLTGGAPGGYSGSSVSSTEEFLGNSWRASISANQSRMGHSGTGNRNSGIIQGGTFHGLVSNAERFNGNAFSFTHDPGAWHGHAAMGGVNNALFAGGHNGVTGSDRVTRYNGSVFSETTKLLITRYSVKGAGRPNASIVVNGYHYGVSGSVTSTEKFFGDAWVMSDSTNTNHSGTIVIGLQNTCLTAGLNSSSTASAEEYNGCAWVVRQQPLYTASNAGGMGNASTGLHASGYNGFNSPITSCEKWFGRVPMELRVTAENTDEESLFAMGDSIALPITGPSELQIEWMPKGNTALGLAAQSDWDDLERFDLGDGAWTAAAAMTSIRQSCAAVGRAQSTLVASGSTSTTHTGTSPSTEHFNGSAWLSQNNMNIGTVDSGSAGVANAAIVYVGQKIDSQLVRRSEFYNGSIWSNGPDLSTTEHQVGSAGVVAAALSFGGGGYDRRTEKCDGVIWSTQTGWNLNTGSRYMGGLGSQNAALAVGGLQSGEVTAERTEKFNGYSWASSVPANQSRWHFALAGTQNMGLIGGGRFGTGATYLNSSEKFNGFLWINASNMLAAHFRRPGIGTQMSMLAMGGESNSGTIHSTVEKFQTELPFSGTIGTVTHA